MSNPVFDLVTSQLSSGDSLRKVGALLGQDEATTSKATGAAVTTILAALAKNAARPDGAAALHGALARDHDGSILNDVTGFIGRGDASPGNAILEHVLGGQRGQVEQGLSQSAGIDSGSAGQLLGMVAPLVLGALGKAQRQGGLDVGALAGMLGGERASLKKTQSGAMGGLLAGMLDTDGDGDVDAKDLAKHGLGLIGKMFNK